MEYRSDKNSTRHRNVKRKRRGKKRGINRGYIVGAGIGILAVVVIIIFSVRGSTKGTNKSGTDDYNETREVNNSMTEEDTVTKENSSSEGSKQDNNTITENTSDGVQITSKGYKIEVKDGVTYVGGTLIANKTYPLPSTFIPTDPAQPVTSERSNTSLDKTLMENYEIMRKDAANLGLNIYIASGYRSYNYQVNLYNRYVTQDGKLAADTYSSRAGHSEHQTGLCFDLNSVEDSFQYTSEGKWVNDNCYKYGFCIRFPKGKEAYTGYKYESWHLRYVGVELATKLYNNGDWISLEEYYGITSEYAD
ncbi:MAG: M15 family metallopeptidase [Eubacteriales bacterium]|nr:M15 family metallopeptidase [Eubacteriales bacterium]